MPDATGPSWKNPSGQPPKPNGTPNRPATSRKAWQPGRPAASTRGPVDPRARYRRRLVMAALCGGLLIGAVVGVILLISPFKQPGLIVLAPCTPTSNIVPYNPAARAAGDFARAFREGRDGPKNLADPEAAPPVGKWNEDPNGKPLIDPNSSKAVVLHFAMPGAADKTDAFLWFVPPTADAADATHRLSVKAIINELAKLDASRSKVLILDAALEPAAWARGQLHNDFARRLRLLDDAVKQVPNLVVICSADEDQRSWVSEVRQDTAFGFFLREGLKGADAQPNERLTVQKLFAYLYDKVPKWTKANRDAIQTPFLLPTKDGDPNRDGDTRATKIVLATVPQNGHKIGNPPGEKSLPNAVEELWARFEELSKRHPRPETKNPHAWRQYLDLLLRAEVTARATGEVPKEVSERLTSLSGVFGEPLWKRKPECVPYSLPAARALGYTRSPIVVDDFTNRIWDQPDEKRNQAWTDFAGSDPDKRLAGADAIIQLLTTKARQIRDVASKANLQKASDLLVHMDAAQPRPIETHVLRMLAKHGAADRDVDLVRLAIEVQVEAELTAWYSQAGEQYPYAEQVFPWFGTQMQAADKRRRDGTDLAFAGTPESAGPARKELEAARKAYDDLRKDAAELGAAYRLRDEIESRLPYYARWAAARRLKTAEAAPALERIERIGESIHKLAWILENPKADNLVEVRRLVLALAGTESQPGEYAQLVNEFKVLVAALPGDQVPSNWHALDAALNVPFIDVGLRKTLLDKIQNISRKLESADQNQTTAEQASPLEMAQRQGRMALAVLGEQSVSDLDQMPLGWAAIQKRVKEPSLGVAAWDSISEAGESLGMAFTGIAKASAAFADKGRLDKDDTAQFQLAKAARLARVVDGATNLTGPNPAALDRRFRTHKLLIELAKRSAVDGWWSFDELAKDGYGKESAEAYLAAADTILFDGETGTPPTEKTRRRKHIEAARPLADPRFDLTTPNAIPITNRTEERFGYRIVATGAATGYPAIRAAASTPPVKPKSMPLGQYRPVEGFVLPGGAGQDGRVELEVAKASDGDKGQVAMELLYRGRVVRRTVDALYAGIPTYEWIYTPPTGPASFAVRGGAAVSNGSVAVLFDVSGSMGTPVKGADGKPSTRFKEAVNGLERVLDKLPAETLVSVHLFAGSAEGLKRLLEPTRWRAGEAQKVCDRIRKNGPEDSNGTPIADSIVAALKSRDVFDPSAIGHRSLIVVTDGAEYWGDEDPTKNKITTQPGEKVVKALRERNIDVSLHLVLFGITDEEKVQARTQFGAVEDQRNFDGDKTPGIIWPRRTGNVVQDRLETSDHLDNFLLQAMLPAIRIRRDANSVDRLAVSVPQEDKGWTWLNPPLEGGDSVYPLFLRQVRQSIQLAPGERMLLSVESGPKGLALTLPEWAKVRSPEQWERMDRGYDPDKLVHMAVPRKLLRSNGQGFDLELTATLEKKLGPVDQLYRQYPRFAWFDVARGAGGKLARLRVENLHNRWAPAWQLTSIDWTKSSLDAERPVVTGYWLEKEERAPTVLRYAEVQGLDRTREPRVVQVDGSEVKVTEVSENEGYLSLRLTHTANKPVVARLSLGDLNQRFTLGEHHVFFGNANEYTVRFGPIARDRFRTLAIELRSIERVRAEGVKIEVGVKEKPTINDTGNLLPEEAAKGGN